MIRGFLILLLFLSSTFRAWSQPQLVVGIVVDQMRYDYLQRYADRFCDSGFKRLMGNGFTYSNAQYNYVPTYTGPGHASIYTGTTPSNHGIIANDWFDRGKGDLLYCAEDAGVESVGSKNKGMSPKNLFSTTITDQLALSTSRQSKIIGISVKDRGAILPAGHAATGAFWFDPKLGKMQSSSWYGKELPKWMEAFNRKGKALSYLDQSWNTLYPITSYSASAPDNNAYEGQLKKGADPVFPYDLKELQKDWGYKLLSFTPFSNSYLVDAAIAALIGEKMGKDAICDFLCLSFSATDYAGHFFGPQAVEIEDMYLRLDRDIARLLYVLDQEVGKGNYSVFLTADHGANEVPKQLNDYGMPGGVFRLDSIQACLEMALENQFGDKLIHGIYNEQVYLNHSKIAELNLALDQVAAFCKQVLVQEEGFYAVYTLSEIMTGKSEYHALIRNGYHPKRSGDVFIQTMPGWMEHWSYGTTHGSGYSYDTHVPILLYGYGIQQGSSSRKVFITDIAPSMSLILGIQFPSANTGEILKEAIGH